MQGGRNVSRRTLLHLLLGGLCAPLGMAAAPIFNVSSLLRDFSRSGFRCRRYRVDATVLVCGVPLFTKPNVGGAFASIETGSIAGSSAAALQFAAGSWPDRAHGLNRFGIWREVIWEHPAASREIVFAGLMTDSREHTLAEGRSALSGNSLGEALVCFGTVSGDRCRTSTFRAPIRPDLNWLELPRVLDEVTRQEATSNPSETTLPEAPIPTFLYAIRAALLQKQADFHQQFVHAGKLYHLDARRSVERPATISAAIRNPSGGRCADFRISSAVGEDNEIPVRIEYRAQPFLRLTLELAPGANQQRIQSSFEENF